MHIVGGFIGVIFSLLIIIYRVPIRRFIGQIQWAEDHLGPGGTYTLLLIVGIVLFFVSLMVMTGTFGLIFGPFTDLFKSV